MVDISVIEKRSFLIRWEFLTDEIFLNDFKKSGAVLSNLPVTQFVYVRLSYSIIKSTKDFEFTLTNETT